MGRIIVRRGREVVSCGMDYVQGAAPVDSDGQQRARRCKAAADGIVRRRAVLRFHGLEQRSSLRIFVNRCVEGLEVDEKFEWF